jgi:hypothetical protein
MSNKSPEFLKGSHEPTIVSLHDQRERRKLKESQAMTFNEIEPEVATKRAGSVLSTRSAKPDRDTEMHSLRT